MAEATAARLDPRNTKKYTQGGGKSVMVWGVITPKGVGRLVRVDGIMDAEKYTKVLQEGLLGTLSDYNMQTSDITFQQDNDSKHTAGVTKRWLEAQGIKVLPWPATSPDMNPIEHVWEYIDYRLRKRPRAARNLDELWEWIQQEWYGVSNLFISALYKSMIHRVADLEAAKGWNTGY